MDGTRLRRQARLQEREASICRQGPREHSFPRPLGLPEWCDSFSTAVPARRAFPRVISPLSDVVPSLIGLPPLFRLYSDSDVSVGWINGQ